MRIGLVGCGHWGKLVLRDLLELGAEVAVAAPSRATRDGALATGAASAHESAEALPPADGYVVATPISRHARDIDTLLPRGRPIYVEKPLTDDPEAAERIARTAPDRVFAMDKWRYHGGVLKLAELARSGALGEVRLVRSWRLGWHNRHTDVDTAWYLAPHDLSIGLEILGELPPVRAASAVATWGTNADVSALLRGDAGPGLALDVSSCHPVNRRSVLVIGSEASAQLGGSYDESVTVMHRDGRTEDLPIATGMPLLAELRAFLGHLEGGPPPKSAAADAALIVRRIAEIRQLAGLR